MQKVNWIILAGLVFLAVFKFSHNPNLSIDKNYLAQLGAGIDLREPDAVFGWLFSGLPEEIMVWPTENYYYFKFLASGKEFWGNIRLAEGERDRGILNFAYWEFNNLPEEPDDARYESYFKKFGPEDGLELVKKSELEYKVGWNGKKVLFKLNNLAQTPPPTLALGEEFLMRTFDESGMRFYLLFNKLSRNFLWVLDESGKLPEDFMAIGDGVVMGKRTNFVFYDDRKYQRKILIGVYAGNIRRNNYFDGPFDQLADNFIKDGRLKEAIEAVYGSTAGKIDNYGFFLDEDGARTSSRTAITPYRAYETTKEMSDFALLCEKKRDYDLGIACLARDEREE